MYFLNFFILTHLSVDITKWDQDNFDTSGDTISLPYIFVFAPRTQTVCKDTKKIWDTQEGGQFFEKRDGIS